MKCRCSRSKSKNLSPAYHLGVNPDAADDRSQSTACRRESTEELYEVFSVGTKSSDAPIIIDATIDKIPVRMEVDTGASRSIMRESQFTSIYPPRKAPALRPISTDLRRYTKEVVPAVVSANVTVGYVNSTHVLPQLILCGLGPTLLGLEWLRINRLNWSDIKRVSISDAGYDTVLNKYPGLFSDGVGTFAGPKVRIHVSADAQPLFQKAKHVPYMM